jgi:GH24 family phage-related lysozyme (muramidase)
VKLSPKGEDFLKSWEELRLTPYLDQGRKWTVGWGHLMRDHEPKHETITLARAKDMFAQDVRPTVDTINRCVRRNLTQQQFDALVAFVFNIGIRAFMTKATLLRLLNERAEDDELEPWWKAWNKVTIDGELRVSNGLVNRRAAEWKVWTRGDYAR